MSLTQTAFQQAKKKKVIANKSMKLHSHASDDGAWQVEQLQKVNPIL